MELLLCVRGAEHDELWQSSCVIIGFNSLENGYYRLDPVPCYRAARYVRCPCYAQKDCSRIFDASRENVKIQDVGCFKDLDDRMAKVFEFVIQKLFLECELRTHENVDFLLFF